MANRAELDKPKEEAPRPLLAVPQSVRWAKVASPLDRKAERAHGRTPTKAAPLLDHDTNQGKLF